MNRAAFIAALAVIAAAGPLAAKNQPAPHIYGPEPSWDEFRRIAEADITGRLIDPESARITWTGGFHRGGIKPFLSGWVQGYYACGLVNARNRMGGYTGATSFVVVIDYDRVLYAEIDNRPGGMISGMCARSAREGLFPPAPAGAANGATDPAAASAAAPAPTSTTSSATGLSLRAMPDGAYVSAVEPGSPAASAGLKAGMVVSSVNAIPLAGMGDAMLKVVDAAGPGASLTVVGGATVKLGASR